jgi:Flp pilus assembly CpaE family ATPase
LATRVLQTQRHHHVHLGTDAHARRPKPDVSIKEFEAGMEAKLRCIFPEDPKIMAKASLKGQPLVSVDPKHRIVGDLHKLCIELAGVPEEAQKKSGFLKLSFARK